MTGAFLMRKGAKTSITSLREHLHDSLLDEESRMERAAMRPDEAASCRWVGFGLGKGVTSLNRDTSVFGVPGKMGSGWHAELVKDFQEVDPAPLCYEPHHTKGFADFARWVYFANPAKTGDFVGVDFGLKERPTAGVAETMYRVAQIAKAGLRHGLPGETELVLLHPRMIELPELTQLRQSLGLIRVADWAINGERLFAPLTGTRCPACGLNTRGAEYRFCYRCDHEFPQAVA